MDLIDRAAALEIIDIALNNIGYENQFEEARTEIEKLPAVEAVQMRRGKWIMKDSGLWQECSVCGVAVEVDSMYMCKASEDMNFNYCPHCGAKMEGLNGRSD